MPDLAAIADELVRLAAEDAAVRAGLVADGTLFEGYHPEMQAVHDRNADRLSDIVRDHGWPAENLFGASGADAAWLIAQHAIGRPDVQRAFARHLAHAVGRGAAPAWQAAMLEDRIARFEGRPQRYGTQFDWDADGLLSTGPVEDPDTLDARRAAIGLPPVAQKQAELMAVAAREGDAPPADPAARVAAFAAWARAAGWRD